MKELRLKSLKWLREQGYNLANFPHEIQGDDALIDVLSEEYGKELKRLRELREQEKAARPGIVSIVARGAVGMTKVALNLDPAPDELKRRRLERCKQCPHLGRLAGQPQCRLCLCLVEAKASLAGEGCPAGLWPGETPKAWQVDGSGNGGCNCT